MRYLFGFLCVCALGLMPLVGCGEDGSDGGSGGSAGTGGTAGTGGAGGSVVACEGTVCPCTAAGIRAAIAEGGGPYTFDCDGPQTVVTEAEIVIDNDVILDGEGLLTVEGGLTGDGGRHNHKVFFVGGDATAELRGLTATMGRTGIWNEGTLTVTNSAMSGNLSAEGGGVWNGGTMTLTNCTVSGNSAGFGAGIWNQGMMTVTDSTVSENDVLAKGGGVWNGGTMTLTNSTVSGNNVVGDVPSLPGIWNEGTMTLTNSTVSGNGEHGGDTGIGLGNVGTLTVTNSVVDGGCDGPVTSSGYNIESPGDTCGFDPDGTDQVDVTEGQLSLGPLQDNGGPTETHALLPGSVAIDVIPADMCDVDEDQRGEPRPGGAMCDVGAFELQEGSL